MSKGLISEQMGAMALVDELRHRQMEVEEHLDLPRREAEVAERIRAYYKSQGIECDDQLVDQGVREFFNQRLVFEAQPMSLWQRFLGRLVISTAFRFWVLFMLACAIWFGVSMQGAYRKPPVSAPASPPPAAMTQPAANEKALARFQQLRDRYNALPLSDADRQRAQQGFTFYANAAAIGGSYADEVLDEFEGQANYTGPALTLSLSALADGKHGVEICKQEDGCQQISHFVFIRATDSEGRPVNFPFSEDDRIKLLPVKGIEVSQAEYQKLKDELHANGSIAERVVGNSPAGNHREFFDSRFATPPRNFNPDKLGKVTVLDSF